MKKYKEYKAVDFLKDDSFLHGFLFSSENDKSFWEDFILKYPDKKEEFDHALAILSSIKFNDEKFSKHEKKELLDQIKKSTSSIKHKKQKFRIYRIVSAACLVAVGLLGYIFLFDRPVTNELVTDIASDTLEIESLNNNTQLILANNKTIVFDEEADITYKEDGKVITGSSSREVVSLDVDKNKNQYNKLIVPKGKKASYLKLEDGSKVWVNSGSTLTFPVSFAKDKREIVVEGEIYIEVAKNTQVPFIVKTSDMHVKVLGTRFNLSAYKGETSQSVVLVEGLVEVQSKDESKKKVLLPDQMLTMTEDAMNINKVNPYDYISWKDGLLQFRSQPLSDILIKLSRHYGVTISCEPDIKDMRCSGKLVLFDEMKDVLETISRTIPLEKTDTNSVPVTYDITGTHVYIKKK